MNEFKTLTLNEIERLKCLSYDLANKCIDLYDPEISDEHEQIASLADMIIELIYG